MPYFGQIRCCTQSNGGASGKFGINPEKSALCLVQIHYMDLSSIIS